MCGKKNNPKALSGELHQNSRMSGNSLSDQLVVWEVRINLLLQIDPELYEFPVK